MKLVIQTQIKENYGAHDWDGTGECPQHWKMKGGSTYVVENINPPTARNIEMDGLSTLAPLLEMLESKDECFEEYALGYELEQDDAAVCEHWETPITLEQPADVEAGMWRATKTYINGEYGYMNKAIAEKRESWLLGYPSSLLVTWVMSNGEMGIGVDWLTQQLEEIAA
jgi:hypothetical protein